MICPYCKTHNHDNAIYCEGCGRYIKKESSSNFRSNNTFLIIVGSLLFLVVIVGIGVALSGALPENTTNNKFNSYSDGKISFNYPGGFTNITSSEDVTGWIYIGDYENSDGTIIDIQKSTSSWAASDARKLWNDTININGSTGEVLSQTTETNQNGITVYKDIYTIKYSDNNYVYKGIYSCFNDKKGLIYCIIVYDIESNYQSVNDTENMIFNSLKLS